MLKSIAITIGIIVSFLIISCKKTDTTKPYFEFISPADLDSFQPGNNIHFQAVFHDNEDLNQYKIIIKNNFTVPADTLPAWNFTIVNELNGKEKTVSLEIPIDDSIYGGTYLFILKALDTSGNEANADTSEISIQ